VLRQARYLLEDGARVLVARLQALEVQDREAAEVADDAGRRRVNGRVERRGEARQVQVRSPRDQEMSTSSGSRVLRLGTMAISSSP
jgi:hypothetical protein